MALCRMCDAVSPHLDPGKPGHACDLSTSVIHPDFYREPLAPTEQASSSKAT